MWVRASTNNGCCIQSFMVLTFFAFRISCGGEFLHIMAGFIKSRPTIPLYRHHLSCIQYFMQGRVSLIKVCASDSMARLLGPWTTLQTSFFLPSISHSEENFTYQDLRIWFWGYVTWTLDYSIDLILLVFSISCWREFYLSMFTHLTLALILRA